MSQPDAQPVPNYVTCPCQHCGGKIEFDANQLDLAKKTTVPCPHCDLETIIFMPEQKVPPVILHDNLRPGGEVEIEEKSRKKIADAKWSYDLGLNRIQAEDYICAVKCFTDAANDGYADAQYLLGVCYKDGLGVAKNEAETIKWWRKAAAQGHSQAQFGMGWQYRSGEGIAKDLSEAEKWFRLSAEQGNSHAQFSLGLAYHGGDGVSQDINEAIKWYRKAAEQGNKEAQAALGLAYNIGQGVPKNNAEAAKWYRLAADQGNPIAQFSLSLAYHNGDGVPQNYVEAYKWANLAVAMGLDDARELRDALTQQMTPSQIEEGQRLASIEAMKIQNPTNHTLQERQARAAIPSEVRREVWRRDGGACVKCGSRRNLEYDHIVPVSKGGSNTARNIELLCESCNRSKSASIQ
jgi:uncharacterized protein